MSCLFATFRVRWANWQRDRRTRALAQMDASIDAQEEATQRRMVIHEEQADVCRRNMDEQLQRYARDPDRNKDAKLKYARFRRDLTNKHEFAIEQCSTMLRNFSDMRDLIDSKRNSAEQHSVLLSELVTKMERLQTNPAQMAADMAKRNARTAMQITRQREMAAESSAGIRVISTAFEEECDAVMEPEAAQSSVSSEIDALFAEARDKFMDASLHDMPIAPTRNMHTVALHSPTKTFGGEQYERVSGDV